MDKNAGTTLRTKLICFIILVLAVAMLPLMAHDLFLAQQNARELVSNTARATLTAAREHIAQHFRQTIAIEAGIILSTRREMHRAAMVAAQMLSSADPSHIAKITTEITRQHSDSPLILFHTGRDIVPGPGSEKTEPALLAALTARARSTAVLGEPDDFAVADSAGRNHLACFVPIKGASWLICALYPLDEAADFAGLVKEMHREGINAYLNSLSIYPAGGIHVIHERTLEDFHREKTPLEPSPRFLIQQAVHSGLDYVEIPTSGDILHCFVTTVPGAPWIIALTVPQSAVTMPHWRMMVRQLALFAGITVLAFAVAFRLAATQFGPLGEIIACVRSFPHQDFTKPLAFGDRLPLKRSDEIGILARALMEMGRMLQTTLDGMLKATAAKERMESELDMARRIQEGFLPPLAPDIADHPAFELFASVTPAKVVGGDLYDVFFVSETKLCIALGDVSGKGVPAALFMSSAVTLLRGLARGMESPAAVLSAINRELAARNPENMFVTLASGLYDTESSLFTYSLAGHPAPVLVPGSDAPCRMLGGFSPDLVAGVMEDACYHDHAFKLEPGDALFFFTDGISEAPSAQGGFFGMEGILAGLESLRTKSLGELCQGMLKLAEDFGQGLPQADDATMLALRRKGGPHAG
ncbi:MAG: serine/threonine-protein phosphatase [Desulfovibrio sp.]|nr:serine/threonine-protein phosphatase [Desulfovibrio sp.]